MPGKQKGTASSHAKRIMESRAMEYGDGGRVPPVKKNPVKSYKDGGVVRADPGRHAKRGGMSGPGYGMVPTVSKNTPHKGKFGTPAS